jgi:hypothetical protein
MADRLKKTQGGGGGGVFLKNHGRHGSVDESPNGNVPLGTQHHHYVQSSADSRIGEDMLPTVNNQ